MRRSVWIKVLTAVILFSSSMKGDVVQFYPSALSSTCVSLSDAATSYLNRYARDPKHNTAKGRRYAVGYFLEHCEREGCGVVADITPETLQSFIEWRRTLGEAPATIAQRFKLVRHFVFRLELSYPDFKSPGQEVRPPVLQLPAYQGYPKEDGEKILEAIEKPRDKAAYAILWRAGLRSEECRELELRHYTARAGWLSSFNRKGIAFKQAKLHPITVQHIEAYLPERERELLEHDHVYPTLPLEEQALYPLIVSTFRAVPGQRESYRVSAKGLYNIIRDAGKKAGVGHIHPHKCRHAFGHDLYNKTHDLRLVAQQLGNSEKAAQRYVTKTEQEQAEGVDSL